MFSIARGVIVAALFLGLSILPSIADAGDKAKAKAHFKAGLSLMEAEDYKGAAVEFETSVSMHPTKNGLFNLANCYKAQHRYGEALETIDKLKIEFKGKLDKEWRSEIASFKDDLNSLVAQLEVKVSENSALVLVDGEEVGETPLSKAILLGPGKHQVEVRLKDYVTIVRNVKLTSKSRTSESFVLEKEESKLNIAVSEKDASVFIDGKSVGVSPVHDPVGVSPGKHLVRIEKKGFEVSERTVSVEPGQTAMLDFALAEESVGPTPAVVAPVSAVEFQGDDGSPTPVTRKENKKKKVFRGLGWTCLVLTVLSAATSGAMYAMAGSEADQFDKAKTDWEATVETLETYPGDEALINDEKNYWDDMKHSSKDAESFGNWGLAAAITGGVFMVGTIVFFVAGNKDDEEQTALVMPTPGGLGIAF